MADNCVRNPAGMEEGKEGGEGGVKSPAMTVEQIQDTIKNCCTKKHVQLGCNEVQLFKFAKKLQTSIGKEGIEDILNTSIMDGPYREVYEVDHFKVGMEASRGYFYTPCHCSTPLSCGGEYVENIAELIQENLINFPELTLTEMECVAIKWLEENKPKQNVEMKDTETMTEMTSKDFIIQMVEEHNEAPPPVPVMPFYRDPNRETLWKLITIFNFMTTITLIIIMVIFR